MSGDDAEAIINRVLTIWQSPRGTDLTKAQQLYRVTLQSPHSEVKKIYRTFAITIHPDKCKLPRCNEAFVAITQARDVLLKIAEAPMASQQPNNTAYRPQYQPRTQPPPAPAQPPKAARALPAAHGRWLVGRDGRPDGRFGKGLRPRLH